LFRSTGHVSNVVHEFCLNSCVGITGTKVRHFCRSFLTVISSSE
jgi:hypothetical protein